MNTHQWQKQSAHATLSVKAKNETAIFEQSLHAIYDFLDPVKGNGVAPIINIDLEGNNMTELLKNFLANVITWSDLHKAHYHTLIIHKITHNHIVGVLEGNLIEKFNNKLNTISSKGAHIEHKDGWFHATIEFSL